MTTLWTLIFLFTTLKMILTESAISNVSLNIADKQLKRYISQTQRQHDHLRDIMNIQRQMSLRKTVASPSKKLTSLPRSLTSLRRTLRESETVGYTFDMLSDAMSREISRELSKRFWDTQFCNYPNKELNNTASEKYCLLCRCDDTCDRNMSCCADIQSMTDTSYRYVRDNYTVCTKHEKEKGWRSREFVVKCPLTYTIEDEQENNDRLKCEGLDNETTLEDWEMIPVSDMTTNTNYMNVYCAICHGVSPDNLTYWLVSMICKAGQQHFILDSCLNYVPPNDVIAESTICYEEYQFISRCNVSGYWEEYDAFTEKACQHLRLFYIASSFLRYQNIFCAICNGDYIRSYIVKAQCPDNMDMGFSTGFTTLVVYNQPRAVHLDLRRECPRMMKFDPLLGRCNAVYCSWPLRLDADTTCGVSVFVDKAIFTIPVTVTVNRPITVTEAVQMLPYIERDARAAGLDMTGSDSDMTFCRIDMFCKTSIRNSSLSSGFEAINWAGVMITDVYVIITAFVRTRRTKAEDAKWPFHSFKRALSNLTTVITVMDDASTSAITIVYTDITTDPWFLRVDPRNNKTLYVHDALIHIIQDPYDNYTIIKPNISFVNECSLKIEAEIVRQMHDVAFISCPAFTYKLSDHGIVRYPEGLFLETADVEFEFGVFKSINESHVKICVDTVTAKIQQNTSIAYIMHASSTIMILALFIGTCLCIQ